MFDLQIELLSRDRIFDLQITISRSNIRSEDRITISRSNIRSADRITISRLNIRSTDRITISRSNIRSADQRRVSNTHSEKGIKYAINSRKITIGWLLEIQKREHLFKSIPHFNLTICYLIIPSFWKHLILC